MPRLAASASALCILLPGNHFTIDFCSIFTGWCGDRLRLPVEEVHVVRSLSDLGISSPFTAIGRYRFSSGLLVAAGDSYN